jgi:hypothetical protein
MSHAVSRTADFAPALVEVEDQGDDCLIVRSPVKLEPCASHLLEYLAQWAESAPDRSFLAEQVAMLQFSLPGILKYAFTVGKERSSRGNQLPVQKLSYSH